MKGVYLMVNLLVGTKGTGKTKKLIEQANVAIQNSKGYVAVVAKGTELQYDINHRARLINTEEYRINGMDAFVGFISGIYAGNYDVTDIFLDSTLKIIGDDMEVFADFIEHINALAEFAGINITVSVSAESSVIPERISKIIKYV